MNQDQKFQQLKEEYLQTHIPPEGLKGMEDAIERAKKDKKVHHFPLRRKIFTATAAAVALCIILPNINRDIAMAMEKIPVIGGLVRVVTFNRYTFEDNNHQADVSVPKIEADNSPLSDGADSINHSVEEYTNQLIETFKANLAQNEGGYEGLDITYDVISDSDQWFTLKLTSLETRASGYQKIRYYHIDKSTGKQVILKDLFKENSDYVSVLSTAIISQMREAMKADENAIYFVDGDMPELDFKQIREDQDFYWNNEGSLVIVFDEYEAAPGYMGNPEFVIPAEVTDGILL